MSRLNHRLLGRRRWVVTYLQLDANLGAQGEVLWDLGKEVAVDGMQQLRLGKHTSL